MSVDSGRASQRASHLPRIESNDMPDVDGTVIVLSAQDTSISTAGALRKEAVGANLDAARMKYAGILNEAPTMEAAAVQMEGAIKEVEAKEMRMNSASMKVVLLKPDVDLHLKVDAADRATIQTDVPDLKQKNIRSQQNAVPLQKAIDQSVDAIAKAKERENCCLFLFQRPRNKVGQK
ncbi:hypothetical protein HDU67_008302 [Dinochytrium kinnereticum]|nr:hypothetical protein HDU67_008302 [Dinochytrium kinnereticum]